MSLSVIVCSESKGWGSFSSCGPVSSPRQEEQCVFVLGINDDFPQ